MTNTLTAQFFNRLLGPSGAYFMEYGSQKALLQNAVFHSFFSRQDARRAVTGRPPLNLRRDTAYRYAQGRLPNKILQHYVGPDGYTYALEDMQHLTALPGRITRLRKIRDGIHQWVCNANLPTEDVQKLDAFYLPHQADREAISVYLAHVMVYVMSAA